MYIDLRDHISELLDDRWYFIRSNIWWFPYFLGIIGIPLWVTIESHGMIARAVGGRAKRKTVADQSVPKAKSSSHLPMDAFIGLYVMADLVASIANAAMVNCVWSTLCRKDDFEASIAVSMIFFAGPLALMLIRRQAATLLRRNKGRAIG